MSSDNGGSGVPIPENVLTTIREIKVTTGKQHADDDVYAMLKQCAMDPNETAQKLLYLDTFQVVKSKREKKRETSNSKGSKLMPYNQRQWARANRNFSSKNGFSGGIRNLSAQREKGSNDFPIRASGPAPSHQERKDTAPNGIKPSTVAANGHSHLPNGVSGLAKTPTVEDAVPAVSSGNSVNKKDVLKGCDKFEKAESPQSLITSIDKETAKKGNGLVKQASVPVDVITAGVASVSVEVSSRNVTFPNHFAVSAFTNGLTFGSFGSSSIDNVEPTTQPSHGSNGGSTKESSPSNRGKVADHSQLSSIVQDETPSPCENNFIHDEQKLNTLLPPPEDSQNHVVQDEPQTFGFLPSMSSEQTLQNEGSEPQYQDSSRPSYLVNSTVLVDSSFSPTPNAQSSSPLPPQQVYRQPYPLGYMPYGHYLSPFYMPHMHQLLGHNVFAQQQTSAGNIYVPPTMASAQQGLKHTYPVYKPGNNSPAGIPSGYSAYGPTSPADVTTTPFVNNEDLASSQLKENHIYSHAQLTEAPAAMWIPQQGQDLNNLQQLNSFYTLPQRQQITDHGAFGMQQPQQTISGVSSAHTVMYQPQSGAVETVGLPPGGTYQFPLMN